MTCAEGVPHGPDKENEKRIELCQRDEQLMRCGAGKILLQMHAFEAGLERVRADGPMIH
jgi:hypothetical protein